jgi:hypothetical protein
VSIKSWEKIQDLSTDYSTYEAGGARRRDSSTAFPVPSDQLTEVDPVVDVDSL